MSSISFFHVRQPIGSSLCGQACIATALDIPLDAGARLIGHRHGTKPKELAAVLHASGFSCSGKRVRYRRGQKLPQRALLSVSHSGNRRRFHWVLLWDGWVYDPERECPFEACEPIFAGTPTLTSFMEIS